ncbi:histidine phosphatase family protein [Cystobacter fuscus]|uniref:histidine phosphatase family protein n=1 Tax=Cystobacter fuscus TaxID=43 RepID=UPI002B31F4BD|nr:histidine phosphatase family protein [Cystobacter fuscus]
MNQSLPLVVLVRHGETAWSRTGHHTGRTDLPLLEEGRQMALKLREPLRQWDFAAVWTSPLRRAIDTCELANQGHGAEQRADLTEWDYGSFEGKTKAEIRALDPDWVIWKKGVPGGEKIKDVGLRADRIIAGIYKAKGPVLLFSHGHLLRVLAARWLGLAPTDGRLFVLGTGSISVLTVHQDDANQPVIQRWNDTHHLQK